MAKKRNWLNCLPVAASALVTARLPKRETGTTGLRAVFAADLHTDADPCRDRTDVLRRAFAGIRRDGRCDVLALCGDITNCGDEKEYALLRRLKKAYLGEMRVLPQIGNHDSWHHSDDPNYPLAERLFQRFCRDCGFVTDKNYYYAAVKGYPFIVTGTQALCHNKPTLYRDQLEWLDAALAKAVQTGKPVFVLSHQPPEGRNGVTAETHEAGMGECSETVDALLRKHAEKATAPILFFSGHIHWLRPECMEQARENLYYVNLPSLEYGGKGEPGCGPGTAALVTVSGDNATVTMRDFIQGKDIPGYEIKLHDPDFAM
ncbi:MAG: metallophosphoesterase [Clostridia bacterium]|nr:metallophosphoesterase [Clostridia bacterium]